MWPLLLLIILIGVGFSATPVIKTFTKPDNNKDYSRWWRAAEDVRRGNPLLAPAEQSFIYPPASAVVFYAPLSFLGRTGMATALCVINIGAHIAVLLLSAGYATQRERNPHPLVYLVPLVVALPYVWDTYFLGQPNLVLLAAMLAGFRLLDRAGWGPVLAGGVFGAAAVAKAFPATVIGYLVWRRLWTAAAAMVLATLLVLLVAPGFVRGFEANARETWTWVDRMILSTSGEKLANQSSRAFRPGNQSMMSVVHRLTRDVEDGPGGQPEFRVNVLALSPAGSFLVFAGFAGGLCLAFASALPARARRTARTTAVEYAILLVLITLFSPKAGSYYYCWSMPGLAVITAEWLRAPAGSWLRRLLLGGLILTVGVMASALSQLFDADLPQLLGATFWGSFLMVLMLLGLLHHLKRLPAGPASERPQTGTTSATAETPKA